MENGKNKHAIVLGGSMAGLTAARVLADHFERVTLIERDVFPGLDKQRRGVPQGMHTHGLLAGGARALERLFPLLTRELVSQGALSADIVRDAQWFHAGGNLARPTSGLDGLLMSRPFVESRIRRRVSQIRNVEMREASHVEDLLFNAERTQVEGVRVAGLNIEADLVVDATGRASKSPQWLADAGYNRPEEERVEVALAYTTRLFQRRDTDLNGSVAAIVAPTPEGKRGGVMLAQEGARWTVTLIGHHGQVAPGDLPGFLDYARHLPSRAIYETIANAQPVGEVMTARYPASIRRRYENLTRFPKGFLVTGDAICSFNPIYGQGMTVASMEAVALHETLTETGPRLATRFFARAAKLVDIPWGIAVGNDLRMPETKGKRTPAVNFINWYVAKLHRAAHHDAKLSIAFHHVANLLAPPESLMNPTNIMRVVRGSLLPSRGSDAAVRSNGRALNGASTQR